MHNDELILFTALCENRDMHDNVAVTYDLLASVKDKIVPILLGWYLKREENREKYETDKEMIEHFLFSSFVSKAIGEWRADDVIETVVPYIYHIANTKDIDRKGNLGKWYIDLVFKKNDNKG